MTLDQLIAKLQILKDQGYQDIPVVAVDGGSGVFSEIGSPSIQKVRYSSDEGWWFEDAGMRDGQEYVELYTGK